MGCLWTRYQRLFEFPLLPRTRVNTPPLVSLTRVPPLEVELWKSQNAYYQLVEALSGANQTRMSDAWLDHFRGLGEWLGVAVPQRSPEITLRAARQTA